MRLSVSSLEGQYGTALAVHNRIAVTVRLAIDFVGNPSIVFRKESDADLSALFAYDNRPRPNHVFKLDSPLTIFHDFRRLGDRGTGHFEIRDPGHHPFTFHHMIRKKKFMPGKARTIALLE